MPLVDIWKKDKSSFLPHKVSIILVTLLLSWLYLLLPPESNFPGPLSDTISYLFMAEYFGGSPDRLAQLYFHNNVFPPLFPVTISLFGISPASAHNLSTMLFLLASVPFYFWLKAIRGSNEAIWITALAWLSPILVSSSLDILSEGLFLVWIFAAFRVSQLSCRRETAMGLALFVACAVLTRSVGVALLPGFVFWLWRGRKELGIFSWSVVLTVLTTPIVAWEMYKISRPGGYGMSYLDALLERLGREKTGYLDVLWQNVSALLHAGIANGGVFLNLLLFALAIPTFFRRLKEQSFDAFFVLTYLTIILIWPFPDQMPRFLLVLAPILVVYALITVSSLLSVVGISRSIGLGVGSIVLFLGFLPANIHHIHRMNMSVESVLQPYKRSSDWRSIKEDEKAERVLKTMYRLALAQAHIQETIPEGDCVYAVFYDLVSYNSKRRTIKMPDSVEKLTKCRYVFASVRSPAQYAVEPMFPISVAGFDRYTLLWVSLNENNHPVAALIELRNDETE